MLKQYILIDTITRGKLGQTVKLTEYEAKTKNYAFALNGVSKKYLVL